MHTAFGAFVHTSVPSAGASKTFARRRMSVDRPVALKIPKCLRTHLGASQGGSVCPSPCVVLEGLVVVVVLSRDDRRGGAAASVLAPSGLRAFGALRAGMWSHVPAQEPLPYWRPARAVLVARMGGRALV